MDYALSLGRRALGTTAENPPVGCVVVKDGRVLGVGWTQPGGRPHAETEALKMAGGAAKGATAFVTLEPCAHHGRTPPCAEALVDAGVARVVTALEDPDSRVSGGGHAILKAAGITVETGLLSEEQIRRVCSIAVKAEVDFVKTSTGFYTGGKNDGATIEMIKVMMDTAKGRIKVKGSGGIRTQQHFFDLIDMGIDRMGIGYKSTPVVLGVTAEMVKSKDTY